MPQIRPLNENLQKSAAEELGENPERLKEDLLALKTWIQQQPHLKANTDDQFLIAFLRGCKYSLEKAKKKIDKFFTLKTKFPEMFNVTDIDNDKFRDILRMGMWLYLPTPLNETGPRICVMRCCLYPADKYNIEEVMGVCNAVQELLMLDDDYACVNGIVFIADFQNCSLGHIFQMTPASIKKITVFAEEAIPFRPKSSHFINTPTGFETISNLVKSMLSQKLQNRFYVHGSKIDSMTQHIPLKYLPKDYGGENGSFDEINAAWEKKLEEYRHYFEKNADYGTNEKLRPGDAIDFDSMFGVGGSFRKLNVD